MIENLQTCKLLTTIVNLGTARKIVDASKKAGARGGTTVVGIGTGTKDIKSIFGIPVETEKEIVLTLVCQDNAEHILNTIIAAGKLDKPGHGISFVIDICKVAGISHLENISGKNKPETEELSMESSNAILYDLIVTIVNKGDSENVIEASRKAGAEGGTIMFGRGTGIHEKAKLFGISIEPEKEIILTLIDRDKTEQVLSTIIEQADLHKPGKGIAFVVEVDKVAGINHALNQKVKAQMAEKRR